MEIYNLSKENYIKSFKYDFAFIDIFHNVNFLALIDKRKHLKEIEEIISTGKYVSIKLLNNVLLDKYGLYIVSKTIPIRNICFLEIVDYSKYKDEIKIDKTDDRFTDLD